MSVADKQYALDANEIASVKVGELKKIRAKMTPAQAHKLVLSSIDAQIASLQKSPVFRLSVDAPMYW